MELIAPIDRHAGRDLVFSGLPPRGGRRKKNPRVFLFNSAVRYTELFKRLFFKPAWRAFTGSGDAVFIAESVLGRHSASWRQVLESFLFYMRVALPAHWHAFTGWYACIFFVSARLRKSCLFCTVCSQSHGTRRGRTRLYESESGFM